MCNHQSNKVVFTLGLVALGGQGDGLGFLGHQSKLCGPHKKKILENGLEKNSYDNWSETLLEKLSICKAKQIYKVRTVLLTLNTVYRVIFT